VASTIITHDVPGGIGVYQQADLALSQDLPAPRQLRAERVSGEADVRQSLVSLTAIRRDVRLRAIDAFYQVATTQNTRDTERSDLVLARASRDIARARARAGDVAQLDVIRAQADVDRATGAELNAEKDLSLARLALGQLLGLPSTQTITVDAPSNFSDRAGRAGNTSVSNTLAQYQYDATQRQINSLVNRALFVQSPSYSLSAGVQAVRSIRPSAIAYGPSMNLTVRFPVIDHGTVRGAVAEAEAARGVAQARFTAQTAEYQTAVQTRIAELSLASERLASAKASFNGMQTAQRLTEVGYRRGKLGLTDVLSARISFLQARTAVNQASVDEMRASAELIELRSDPLVP
jgi:multidrug efflux system outer membrane protein